MVKKMSLQDKIKKDYFKATNMSLSKLKAWRKNPCSAGSGKSLIVAIILKNKKVWSVSDHLKAAQAIKSIKRIKKTKAGKIVNGCGVSRRTAKLMNHGFNPNK